MSKKNGIANPIGLKPADGKDKQLLRVVIETPKGSRNNWEAKMPNEGLKELYIDELKDLYNAENQLVKALPKLAKATSSEKQPRLRRAS